jgi:hypothetical protein
MRIAGPFGYAALSAFTALLFAVSLRLPSQAGRCPSPLVGVKSCKLAAANYGCAQGKTERLAGLQDCILRVATLIDARN